MMKKLSFLVVLLSLLMATIAGAEELKIMSYDFTAGAVAADIYTIVSGESPDIIGAQACSNTVISYLSGRGYNYVGIDRDGGNAGEFNPIFYNNAKLSVIDSGTFWLSSTPYATGSMVSGSICRRICTWAIFHENATQNRFIMLNTHLDHSNETIRLAQINNLLAVAEKYSLPMVLTGSMNSTEGNDVYKAVTGFGLLDSKYQTTDSDTGRTYHNKGTSSDTLPRDYCFVSKEGFGVSSYKIIRTTLADGSYPSNYYPVLARVTTKPVEWKPEQIRVMSFNVRCGEITDARKSRVLTTIKKYGADIFGVQEATVDWMNYLNANLTEYSSIGIGRDPGNSGEFSAIFFKKTMFSLLDSGTFWLSETPEVCSIGWGAACNRICTWGVFRNRHTEEVFAYFNTHLDHVSALARQNGLALVMERINELGLPAILTGDFNFNEFEEAYPLLVQDVLADTKYLAASSDTGGTYHNYGNINTANTKPIDYCLVSKNLFTVKNHKIVRDTIGGEYVSDHYPVYADIRRIEEPTSAAQKDLKMMSYNVTAGCSAEKVYAIVQAEAPDLLGLQATRGDVLSYFAACGYSYVGIDRDGGSTGEFNPILYKNDVVRVVDSGTFWLSDTPGRVASCVSGALYNRICTWAVFEEYATGTRFVMMNTHLDHSNDTVRLAQINHLLTAAKKHSLPVVLTGSMNNIEDGCVYEAITSSGLLDTKYQTNNTDSGRTYHNHGSSSDTLPRDFCFVSDGDFTVSSYQIIRTALADGSYPSSYYPVVSHIRTKKAPPAPEQLRVMSFNVRCGELTDTRMSDALTVIFRSNPDLLGVQEATVEWMNYLSANLTGYGFIGIGRDPGSTGEYSAIFYKKGVIELLDSGTFWLSETPEECSYGWDADCRRVCTWGVFRNRHTEEVFAHFNAHLDHIGTEARANGIKLILERIKAQGFPTVLTGDFNFGEGTEAYPTIVASAFSDTKHIATSSDSGGTFHNYGAINTANTLPIDFCFVSDGDFTVETYKIVKDTVTGAHISDHYPIYADITLKPQSSAENTVMSFNLSMTNSEGNTIAARAPYVRSVIGMHAPDIIGFQAEGALWQRQLSSLRERYTAVGEPRTSAYFDETNRIYYLSHKYTLLDSDTFWLSETPEQVGSVSWGAACPRICTYAVLQNRYTGEIFACFNTHLDHISSEARANAIPMILKKIEEIGYPVVLLGTLKEKIGETVYEVAAETLSDARLIAADSDSGQTYHAFGTVTATAAIDHCFLTDNYFDVQSYKIIRRTFGGSYPSAHYPVLVKLALQYDISAMTRETDSGYSITVTDTRKDGEDAYGYLACYDDTGRMLSCTSLGKLTKEEEKTLTASGPFAFFAWNNEHQPLVIQKQHPTAN